MTTPAKSKALRDSGTLNPHPEAVRSELFQMDFFDPYDLAQVKYEMLRAHSVDEDPVAEACRQFGLSRESFYQIERAFHELGFCSFLPRKRGRQGPVKLKGEVLQFALAQKKEHRDKLLEVYEFLTREVMVNASCTLRPNSLPDSGSELCCGITVGSLAELWHPERNGDCRGVHRCGV